MSKKFEKQDAELAKRTPLDKALNHSTPESFVEWMIECHSLPEGARQVVLDNLTRAYETERLKGSLVPLTGIDIDLKIFGYTVIRIKSRT